MNQQLVEHTIFQSAGGNGALLLGAGLALASVILITRIGIGLGASLAGALRMTLIKAGNQASQR
jgi:hypothetical protein